MKKIIILATVLLLPSLTQAATLSVSPSAQNVKTGDTLSISVILDTQGESIDGVDIKYLNFNPALLQVVDANSSISGVQITSGSLMSATLLNSVDNTNGKISFSQVVSAGTKYKGSGTLATINFKVKSAGTANLTFNFTPNNTTDSNVATPGKDVLTAVVNGSYIIKGTSANSNTVGASNTGNSKDTIKASQTESNVSMDLTSNDATDIDTTVVRPTFFSMLNDFFKRIKNGIMNVLGL